MPLPNTPERADEATSNSESVTVPLLGLADEFQLPDEQHTDAPTSKAPPNSIATSSGDKVPSVREEASRILKLGIPISSNYLLSYLNSIIATAFVGHLGPEKLSAAVLGTSVANVTGYSVLIGLSSAIETFCGQAYGAQRYSTMGIVLQRALLVEAVALVPIVAVWSQADKIMIFIGQEPSMSIKAARYIMLMIPYVSFNAINSCLSKYFMVQGIVLPITMMMLVATSLAPFWNWLFIYRLGLGFEGAPLANGVAAGTNLVLLLCYFYYREAGLAGRPEKTWHGWSRQAFSGWGQYFGLALPSTVMMCLEWWLFEAVTLMAGRLPNPDVAVSTMGIAFNTAGLFYCFFALGFSGATSTRVSNELGAGRPRAAKQAVWVSAGLVACALAVMTAFMVVLQDQWVDLFTENPEVHALAGKLIRIVMVNNLMDGVCAVFSASLRGAARQKLGATINIFSYWCVGLPLCLLLAFQLRMGVEGLWLGLTSTTGLQLCIMALVIARSNWQLLSRQAQERAAQTRTPVAELPQEGVMYDDAAALHAAPNVYSPRASSFRRSADFALPP